MIAVLAVLLGIAVAPFKSIDVLKTFHAQLPKIHAKTSVPVLLPKSLPLAGSEKFKVYATGGATKNAWDLEIDAAPNCGGANACFIASFEGKRGGKLPGKSNAKLPNGDAALYLAFSCGGSCSPTSLYFVHAGVLYSWQHKDAPPKGTKAIMLRLAAEAVAAGPR